MIGVKFRVPIASEDPPAIEKSPCCGSGVYVKEHGQRGVDDIRIGLVRLNRYTCESCAKSFTARPAGVSRSSKSAAVKAAAVVLYLLGLSYDAVIIAFSMFGVELAKSTVYNYVQAAGQSASKFNRRALRGPERFLGADTTGWKIKRRNCTASWLVDLLTGKTIAVEFIENEDEETFLGLKYPCQSILDARRRATRRYKSVTFPNVTPSGPFSHFSVTDLFLPRGHI